MNEKDFKIRTKIIKDYFHDTRTIKCHIPTEKLELNEHIKQDGDFFLTEGGELIDLEFQLTDFRENELVEYVELAEALYEKIGKEISIDIICPKYINVYVKEIDICSDAEFKIKLRCSDFDPCEIILDGIKDKIKHREVLDEEDIHVLEMLPQMCRKKEKKFYRLECFKILNRYSK